MTGPEGSQFASEGETVGEEGNMREARGVTSNSQTLLYIRITWEVLKKLNTQLSPPID